MLEGSEARAETPLRSPIPGAGQKLERQQPSLSVLSHRVERNIELSESLERMVNRLYHALTGESIPSDEAPNKPGKEEAIIPLLISAVDRSNSALGRTENILASLERILTHDNA